jgi:hypothetical protein
MQLKTCSREDCEHSGNPQPISNFYKRSSSKDGYRSECKSCKNKASNAWKEENKERRKKVDKAWREANKERCKKVNKAWREANKEYCKKKSKAWREANKEHRKKLAKAWYEANKKHHNEKTKAWNEANKERKKETDKAWREARRIAEGKELGVKTPPTNFYIGFLEEAHGTYFKVGITSYDSMAKRFKRDSLSEFIACEELAFIECASEEEARSMEREFISLCTKELGSPVLRKERFDAADKKKCISIAKKATPR